tara:strand:+ start:398 stop:829 length:432 start_codon:yes stop_codon:yes gene_type:complete
MKIMTEKFKILTQFIKDMSSETPDIETHLFVKNQISKYQLNIDINSKPLKNKMIEINTILKFNDKELSEKKSNFEIIYSTIIKISDEVESKKDLEKIILCDVQNEIYPNLKKTFLNLLHDSGYPEIKLEKKIDFEKMYNEKFN